MNVTTTAPMMIANSAVVTRDGQGALGDTT